MALNSINTNVAALQAQSNIGKANNAATASIARLSSGSRITRAADDVAALSAGTSLRTNVTTLRTAMINTSQGASLLQVADGALAQITDILQRQKAIAVQAGSGSLTSSERGFLNQEFTNLTAEIDRLASQTNFNGVTLLDGSLFDITALEQNTDAASQATANLSFIGTQVDAAKFVLQGITLEFDTNGTVTAGNTQLTITAGATVEAQVAEIATFLNSSTNALLNGASYSTNGNTLIITARSGGTAAEQYTFLSTTNAAVTASVLVTGRLINIANTFTLQAQGTNPNNGIAAGDTTGFGTIGDSIIAAQSQVEAFASISFANTTVSTTASATELNDGDTVLFSDGNGSAITFEFDTNGTVVAGQPRINVANAGTNVTDWLDALVNAVNNYGGTANNDYVLEQIEARREGTTVIFENRDVGNIVQADDRTTAIGAISVTGATDATQSGSATLANGTNTGINTSLVTNSAFVGTVGGFSANYTGNANRVDLSITVGERTYTASNVNVTADATLQFVSVEGDAFSIQLQGATQTLTATNQAEADLIANRLDTAFASITFFQDRDIASYTAAGDIISEGQPTGSLTGSSFSLQGSSFDGAAIDDVRVSAPLTGTTNGIIEFDINGTTYRSRADIGSELGSSGVFEFTSLTNANDVLTFRVGNIASFGLTTTTGTAVNSIEFDTNNKAQAFENALKNAFGIGKGGATLDFQVGVTTDDTLAISIGNVSTESIYQGLTLDVLTKETAAAASDALDAAIDAVTSVRAEVGALQSRFDFASANIESSIQNQESARGVLLDTDVVTESTASATAQVQLQAGISVLAQANLLPQNLLKLIG